MYRTFATGEEAIAWLKANPYSCLEPGQHARAHEYDGVRWAEKEGVFVFSIANSDNSWRGLRESCDGQPSSMGSQYTDGSNIDEKGIISICREMGILGV